MFNDSNHLLSEPVLVLAPPHQSSMAGLGGPRRRLLPAIGMLATLAAACSVAEATHGQAGFVMQQGALLAGLRSGIRDVFMCRRVHAHGTTAASRGGRRCVMVAMAERETEAGDAVPTRKKKAVPQHVQEILQQDSMAENVLEQLPTLQDFEPVRKVRREDPGSKAPPKLIKTELYVRGIPYEMDNDGLKELFKVHKPRSSRVMKDKQGRRPLGFGFVTFYNEFKAAEAMAAMNGFAVRNERGIETQLVISYATEKKVKVKNRDLSTRSSQQRIQDTIAQRKAEIIARDSHKVVMDLRDMPRSFQRLADRNPDMVKELQESVRKGAQDAGRMDDDDVMDMEDAEARALRLVEDFKEGGNRIEDVTDRQLRQERDAEEDDEVDRMLYGEIGDSDEDWVFVPDGADGGPVATLKDDENDDDDDEDDYPDETEEERAAWIEYKKKQDAKRDA